MNYLIILIKFKVSRFFVPVSVCSIVLPELQRFYGKAIVIITSIEMPIADLNRQTPVNHHFRPDLSVYKVILERIYD
jgi:hypothetical protein